MLETILLVLLMSRKKGYSIKPILTEKALYPVVACEVVYWCLQITLFAGNYYFLRYAAVFKSIYLCSYLFLVFRYELYRYALIGSGFIILGGWCNDIAMAANAGQMPVFPTLSYMTGYIKPDSFMKADAIHILGSSETNLKILTDIFDLGYSVLSIGDIFIRVFVFLILLNAIKCANHKILKAI